MSQKTKDTTINEINIRSVAEFMQVPHQLFTSHLDKDKKSKEKTSGMGVEEEEAKD